MYSHTLDTLRGRPAQGDGAPRPASGSKRRSLAGRADPGQGSWDSPGVSPTFGALVLLQMFSRNEAVFPHPVGVCVDLSSH